MGSTYTINAGETKYFRVYATINDADNFPAGKYLKVSYDNSSLFRITSTRTNIVEAGSAIGENQSFYSQGAVVKFVSDSYTAPDVQASTQGTIALTFTVTAFGDNDITINNDDLTGPAAVVATLGSNDSKVTGTIVTASGMTADGLGNFIVSAGDTKTFTISKKLNTPTGFVSMKITNVAGNSVSNVETRQF